MQTMETPDRRTENAVERNVEAARRLFRAVEHRDRAGVMAYDENIVINEASESPRMAESTADTRVRFAMDWASAQRGTVSQPQDACGLDPWFVAQGDHVVAVGAEGREHADRTNRSARRQHLPLC